MSWIPGCGLNYFLLGHFCSWDLNKGLHHISDSSTTRYRKGVFKASFKSDLKGDGNPFCNSTLRAGLRPSCGGKQLNPAVETQKISTKSCFGGFSITPYTHCVPYIGTLPDMSTCIHLSVCFHYNYSTFIIW